MKQFIPQNPQQNTNWKMRITQVFWDRPKFYKKYWLKGHEGIDINPKPGIPTPIYAVFDWNTYIKKWGAYWNRIDLYDDKGLVASYCHLSKINITRKQRVKAGDLLWYSWKTWNSWAIHLHFMIKECNPQTGQIHNERNWYLWSIPVKFDKQKNKLFIDTKKIYFEEKEICNCKLLEKKLKKEKQKNKLLEKKLKDINKISS